MSPIELSWTAKNGTSSSQIFSAPALFCSGGFILPLEASKECGLSTDQRLDCSIIGINRRSSSLQLVATWRHHDASELVCTSSKFKARKLPLMSCFEFHTLVSHNYGLRTHFFTKIYLAFLVLKWPMRNQRFWFWWWRRGKVEASVGKDDIDDEDILISRFWWSRFWWWSRWGGWVEASVGKSQVETFALQRSLPHNGHFHPELRGPKIGMTNTILKHHLILYFATPPTKRFAR